MTTSAQKALSTQADAILAAGKGKGKPAPTPVAATTPAPVAPAPVAPAAPAVAVQHKATPASGPQFKLGTFWQVAVNSHRGYAQAVASHLAKDGATFTLGALRAALVANPLPADHPCAAVLPPKGGWAKHNMPTWGAAQGWWVQA